MSGHNRTSRAGPNVAPLHELVPWREARNYWAELLAGKYSWSSIAQLLRAKGLVK